MFTHTHTTCTHIPTQVDDGSGATKVWRVEDFKLVEVPEDSYGQFFCGDSYVVQYTYTSKSNREQVILYFWQGRNSSKDEVGASAVLASELDEKLGGAPVQCRVVQGKEPAHLRALFGGKMVVRTGGHASSFKKARSMYRG